MPRKNLVSVVGSIFLWMFGILWGFAFLQKHSVSSVSSEKPAAAAQVLVSSHSASEQTRPGTAARSLDQ
jgi:hypothetical protein